jgi:enoyl-CoA hydratase/carnithine racemase
MAIEYRVADSVATIHLNRPRRRNAFTIEMIDDWAAAIEEAQRDNDVRCVVLSGEGGHFCSGADLDHLASVEATPLARKRLFTEHIHRVIFALERLDRPIIAAVQGVAVGAGLDMALMCDIRFAGRSARLSTGYVRVGLVPGDGGCYLLPRLVGMAKALELLLGGEFVDAAEALRIGLVNRVYEDDELAKRTYQFAHRLAAGPPVTMQLIKRATYQSARSDLATSMDLISSHIAVVMSTMDTAEALAAARERRPAVPFHGR